MNWKKISRGSLVVLCLLSVAGYFYPLPYYISKPGMAKELEPIVSVENRHASEGSFMLTTIQMGKANIYTYALADWLDYWSVYKEEDIKRTDETDEEYNVRQLYLMEGSKVNAIISAFREAKMPYETHYEGVYVLSALKNMPAYEVLQAGDRITKVNGEQLTSSEQLMTYIKDQPEGSTLRLEIVREGESIEKSVQTKLNPENNMLGIGIVLVDDRSVETDPKVEIDSSKIGGPSAGLMFSLEIYNQLVEEDITKGYHIAGTGTIDEDGNVGAIGGIDQKVVAASESGASVFFAPNENGEKNSNYSVALQTAKDIGTSMIIVPVDTMEDALNYLQTME